MKITLTNNLRLSGIPAEFRQILIERLTLANPKWFENERMKRWNRNTPKTLKFFDKVKPDGLWIPRGFMRQLILLCRKHRIPYRLDDQRRQLEPVEFNFSGGLKPFQQLAVESMIIKEFGTLSAPTGSGKTVMALELIARRKQPALIVVHTRDLAYQWIDRIGEFLGISKDHVGLIGAGKMKRGDRITVGLVQSLYQRAEKIAPFIGHLIVDECHRTPSRTFTDVVTDFDARFMLGLSATPWRRDKLSKLIFWHLGDVHHQTEKADLIKSGDVLSVEVVVRKTDFEPYYDPVDNYSKMLSELATDDQRNRLIAADVAKEAETAKGVVLVLSDRKLHCETLQALLRYKHNVPSTLLTGDLSGEQRRDVLDRLNRGEIGVLIATGQLIGEGFDHRELSTLFMATPVRFSGRVLQYLGRVLRPAEGKLKARVFDYVDVKVDVLRKAAKGRQRVYNDLSAS